MAHFDFFQAVKRKSTNVTNPKSIHFIESHWGGILLARSNTFLMWKSSSPRHGMGDNKDLKFNSASPGNKTKKINQCLVRRICRFSPDKYDQATPVLIVKASINIFPIKDAGANQVGVIMNAKA